jgi:hypothetical protein
MVSSIFLQSDFSVFLLIFRLILPTFSFRSVVPTSVVTPTPIWSITVIAVLVVPAIASLLLLCLVASKCWFSGRLSRFLDNGSSFLLNKHLGHFRCLSGRGLALHNWLGLGNRLRLGLNFGLWLLFFYLHFFWFLLENIIDNLLLVYFNMLHLLVSVLFCIACKGFLQLPVIGKIFECVGESSDGGVKRGVCFVALLKQAPEGGKACLLGQFCTGVVNGKGASQDFKFFKLIGAVVHGIFCVYLLEEGNVLLYFDALFEEVVLAVYFLKLFGFEVVLAL